MKEEIALSTILDRVVRQCRPAMKRVPGGFAPAPGNRDKLLFRWAHIRESLKAGDVEWINGSRSAVKLTEQGRIRALRSGDRT